MPRPVELLLASVALIVLAPMIAVALALSALSLRAWPVFRQQRIGRNDELFTIYKVRTLRPEVSTSLDKYRLGSLDTPTLCRMMRRYHVDELLQLLNVLNGSMSIVGPRPEMPHLADRMNDAHRSARRFLRPGMTGLWQISVDAKSLIFEHPEYDIAYASARSAALDVRIAVTTVGVAVKARAPLSYAECQRLTSDARLATSAVGGPEAP